MMRELVGKPVTVGIVGLIDPRTYQAPGLEGGSVKAAQLPVVMRRLRQVAKVVMGIKLYDGSPLKVVVAGIPVGGPRDAAIVQQMFEEAGVDCVINSMATWSMGWETQPFGHPEWPVLYEAMNGTNWPGAVLLNSLRASATAHLRPVWCSYPPDVEGLPGSSGELHPVTVQRIQQFLKAAAAITIMRGKSYASIGHVSMGIAGSEPVSDVLSRWFGMKLAHVDQLEAYMRVTQGMYDKEEAQRAVEWFLKTFEGRIDPQGKRTPAATERLVEQWLVPMTLVVRDIMRGNDAIQDEERSQGLNAIVGGTAGQRYWTDWCPNWDFPEAILSSMFDWNGHRPPITLATENDWANGLGMLWGTLLTGYSSLFADLRTYWSPKALEAIGYAAEVHGTKRVGILDLRNSGPAALEWGTDVANLNIDARRAAAIEAVEWHPANLGYFPHDGLSTQFQTPGNRQVTLLRLNRIGPDLTLSVFEGQTVKLPAEIAKKIGEATDPTWPVTFVTVDREEGSLSSYEVMSRGIDPNHVVAAIGHIGTEVLTLAAMLRIPVDCHNIPEKRIWRPTLWTRLGGDREACRALGPLYA